MKKWGYVRLLSLFVLASSMFIGTSYADVNSSLHNTGLFTLEVELKELQEKEFNNKVTIMNTPIYVQEKVASVKTLSTSVEKSINTQLNTEFYDFYKKHCESLTEDTATLESLTDAYNKVGYLWKTEKIDMFTFKQILSMLEYTYNKYGVYSDKNEYLRLYQNEFYQHSWEDGIYDKYMASILGYGNLGNPYGYKATVSGDMVLAVADSWTKGTSGEKLRYSQTQESLYTSVISDKQFIVRPDCTGFCYTVLKELGCTVIDSETLNEGFYSGSMVRMCRSGEFETDPNIQVLPFDVNILQAGDIMVTAKTERLTKWGTTEAYDGVEGHAEIFVGFPDENDKSVIDVWNWGSYSAVENNFPVDAESFTPQRKHPSYNYTYIVRYIGGTRH
jgi:hypothetical protein